MAGQVPVYPTCLSVTVFRGWDSTTYEHDRKRRCMKLDCDVGGERNARPHCTTTTNDGRRRCVELVREACVWWLEGDGTTYDQSGLRRCVELVRRVCGGDGTTYEHEVQRRCMHLHCEGGGERPHLPTTTYDGRRRCVELVRDACVRGGDGTTYGHEVQLRCIQLHCKVGVGRHDVRGQRSVAVYAT